MGWIFIVDQACHFRHMSNIPLVLDGIEKIPNPIQFGAFQLRQFLQDGINAHRRKSSLAEQSQQERSGATGACLYELTSVPIFPPRTTDFKLPLVNISNTTIGT